MICLKFEGFILQKVIEVFVAAIKIGYVILCGIKRYDF